VIKPRLRTNVRNITITTLLVTAVLLVGLWRAPTSAQELLSLRQVDAQPPEVAPGNTVNLNFELSNTQPGPYNFNVTVLSSSLPSGVQAAPPGTIQLAGGAPGAPATQRFVVQLSTPNTLASGTTFTIQIQAAGTTSAPGQSNTTLFTFARFRTTGQAPTNTPQPTVTVGPSPTPGPVCSGGRENDDPGNDRDSARLILVNLPQRHGICAQGDVDWYEFGAVGGKVYTIDVTEMDAGLDLVIELYDTEGNLILTNDDFFARNASPQPTDLRPRVGEFRAPRDGIYFFVVRDSLNIGGNDTEYIVAVLGESFGPTPATIPSICRDLYEEDGLPEEATLITSNELQPAHVLCPDGDADWVRFFGKAGKTYYLYTDTRPYANPQEVFRGTQAGADTVMYLTDRDGVSILDMNDDIIRADPVNNSLDSEIRFVPSVDGFYFAQIKNNGDIGNQFIRYDLVLKLCIPGQESMCNRAGVAEAPTPITGPASTPGTGGGTTPTDVSFGNTPTPTQQAAGLGALRTEMVEGQIEGFVHPSFAQVWQRSDKPIVDKRVERSWMWGPKGLMARGESYAQSSTGMRQVEYFDKARMELNLNEDGSSTFVTNGLLAIELIGGRMQVGNNEFVQREAADIAIAGDENNPNAPTYASFAGVTGEVFGDRTGETATDMIARSGQITTYDGGDQRDARLVRFVPETGHNIPKVFWDYLNGRGVTYQDGGYRTDTVVDWVFAMGYPISEPYWAKVQVGGSERDVLIQVFQRRVLTYSPDNPEGWQVEMGNVGRHYYFWRYGEHLPQ
jgi:hypothetical protein